jgi:hypothetical protein
LRSAIAFLFSVFLLLLIGCGSVSSNTQGTPTPTPTPMISPTPTPSPTPPAASDSFLTTMFLEAGRNPSPLGPLTFDTTANNGSGNLQLTSAGFNNTTLILQFCPYPQGFNGCFNVASITTDATGNANMNFTFPQKGTYSGTFQLNQTNTAQFASTATGSTGTTFRSALLPAATVTGGIQQTTGNAPGSGTAVMSGTTAHITLAGTTPNHTFNTAVCSLVLATQCAALANLTTDAQGKASADVGTVQAAGWSVFRVSDSDGVEFVTAFRVQ